MIYGIDSTALCQKYGLTREEAILMGCALLGELEERNLEVSEEVFNELLHQMCEECRQDRQRQVDNN